MNLTDNEIIKALKCCRETTGSECLECPLFDVECSEYDLYKLAFDLINRQNKTLKYQAEQIVDLKIKVKEQRAEIERYKGVIRLLEKNVKTAKDDGAKEFAKLCIDKAVKGVIYAMDIPDYVQEMVGDIK